MTLPTQGLLEKSRSGSGYVRWGGGGGGGRERWEGRSSRCTVEQVKGDEWKRRAGGGRRKGRGREEEGEVRETGREGKKWKRCEERGGKERTRVRNGRGREGGRGGGRIHKGENEEKGMDTHTYTVHDIYCQYCRITYQVPTPYSHQSSCTGLKRNILRAHLLQKSRAARLTS